ncbi:MAG: DUF1365 domain-containing protein [Thiofilum sp.]|uniref:DUF1365 domain-containing protein n=1 Tax=Thiofilum sp. TaxID=2212733 RepID=UPI0025ED0428|nr:DUF1365 domain-containing protein [Thiofilum sp.]MBK8455378.1 DUF1365 domain-containing protein [Thiofilum sp.]
MTTLNSALYSGTVGHCRYQPRLHRFKYSIFLLALDLDELDHLPDLGIWFKVSGRALMSFRPDDYMQRQAQLTRAHVWEKVSELGGDNYAGKVVFLGQVRCLGVYFSPVNFYYCHDQQEELRYLVAEVSNTPWNERHYYLINAQTQQQPIAKAFHVSPFMDLAINYHWRFSALAKTLTLQIENQREGGDKLFDATLVLQQRPLTKTQLRYEWLRIPAMTLKTVGAIYWQALKLWMKRIPYVPYSRKAQEMS